MQKSSLGLDKTPERFSVYNEEPWKSRNTRMLIEGNFKIFYLVDKENADVVILRVLYYRQNDRAYF
jgi:toxin ParE1/3/4